MQFKNKYLYALIPLLFFFGIIYYFLDIFTYIILAWVISMIGTPLMRLYRRFFSRALSALFTLASFTFILILLVWLFVPPLYQQARNLSEIDYKNVVESLEEPIKDWSGRFTNNNLADEEALNEDANIAIDSTPKTESIRIDTSILSLDSNSINLAIELHLSDFVDREVHEDENKSLFERYRKNIYKMLDPSSIPKLFSSIVGFLGNFMITIASIFFIAFFFLKEQGLFGKMISSIVPNEYDDRVNSMIEKSSALLIRYFIGVAVQIIVITIFISAILGIFNINNALLIGFFAALINVIPYLGPLLGASFGSLITISSNLNVSFYEVLLPQIIIIAITFLLVQLIDNFILQPTIFSKSVKAHPLEIFIVVLLGAKIGGIFGMVVAIPTYTVLRVIAKVFLGEFKLVQKITKGI